LLSKGGLGQRAVRSGVLQEIEARKLARDDSKSGVDIEKLALLGSFSIDGCYI